MSPLLIHDDSAAAYRELRSLAESLLDASVPGHRDRVAAALAQFLLSHCSRCGDILPRSARLEAQTDLCLVCEALHIPSPPGPQLVPDPGDVPF